MSVNILTVAEAVQSGTDFSMLKVCKELRRLANLGRIMLDESEHRSKLNRHLFAYLEYCGVNVREYLRGYLANLQPFMIERFAAQEKANNFICVLDNLYRISLYIKVDKTFGHEVIISFHENNKRGIAKENNMIRNVSNRIVPVFADEICARTEERDEIKLFLQRGVILLPVQVMGKLCENGLYLVHEQDLEIPVINQCNQYLRDLYTSDLDLAALDQVELFSVLQQISFTSYGNTVFSNISLLIDNLAIQKSVIGKKAADFALTVYVEHLLLNADQAVELCDLLDERYSVSSSPGTTVILDRVKDHLRLADELTELDVF